MLSKLFVKKNPPKEYVLPVLENLTTTQQKHYERFKGILKDFCLSKDIENPSNDVLYIGISDGYLGSIPIGEIIPDGTIHLKYPNPQSIDSNSFREILSGTLRLRETLEQENIPYKENITREEYAQQVRELCKVKNSVLEARIKSYAY